MKRFLVLWVSASYTLGVAYGSVISSSASQISVLIVIALAVAGVSIFQNRQSGVCLLLACLLSVGMLRVSEQRDVYQRLSDRAQVSGSGFVRGEALYS